MTKPLIVFHNAATNEIEERQMTDEEFAQWQLDKAANQARTIAENESKAKREAALAKLEALGLTENDLKALGL